MELIHFLGGLASGAGQEYSRQKEEERANKYKQNEIIANALDKDITSNSNYTDEERDQRKRASLKTRGVPDQEIERIMGHVQGLRTKIAPQMKPSGGGPADESVGSGLPGATLAPPVPTAGAPQAQSLAGPIPQMGSGETAQENAPQAGPALAPPLPKRYTPRKFEEFSTPPARTGARDVDNADRAAYLSKKNAYDEKVGENIAMHEQTQQMMEDYKAAGYTHFMPGIAPNGAMTLKPDTGTKVPGTTIVTEDMGEVLDPKGKPVPVGSLVRMKTYSNGDQEGVVVPGVKAIKVEPDPKSSTGFSYVGRYQNGSEVHRSEAPAPGAYVAKTNEQTSTAERKVDVTEIGPDGKPQIVSKIIPMTTTASRTSGPTNPVPTSATPATAIPAAPGATRPATPAGTPKVGGRNLGIAPSEAKRLQEPELEPWARKVTADNQPIVDAIGRAKEMLKKDKDSNVPFSAGVDKLLYNVGIATADSQLINNLELGKVQGGARLLKNASRSIQALQIAMQHLPNAGRDSSKLMFEKLDNAEKNLNDIIRAAREGGAKYPGLHRPGQTATPATSVPEKPASVSTSPIRVKRKADGKTGTIDPSDFSDDKYEKL